MVSHPDLLLICRDTDLGLLMSFLLVIKHQTEHGVILIWDHSFYLECWHADVDQDDSVHPNENGVSLGGTRLVVL